MGGALGPPASGGSGGGAGSGGERGPPPAEASAASKLPAAAGAGPAGAAAGAAAGAGDFDPAKYSCPHPLPLADERLRWYFARRDVNEAATKAAFPALLLALLESPCVCKECQNARAPRSCRRTQQTRENMDTHWFAVEVIAKGGDTVFSLIDILEAVIAEDH